MRGFVLFFFFPESTPSLPLGISEHPRNGPLFLFFFPSPEKEEEPFPPFFSFLPLSSLSSSFPSFPNSKAGGMGPCFFFFPSSKTKPSESLFFLFFFPEDPIFFFRSSQKVRSASPFFFSSFPPSGKSEDSLRLCTFPFFSPACISCQTELQEACSPFPFFPFALCERMKEGHRQRLVAPW